MAEFVADPISAGFGFGTEIVKAFEAAYPNPNERLAAMAKAHSEAQAAAQASDTTQATIMAAEAAQKGWFNKPHIAAAWICLGALVLDLLTSQGVWLRSEEHTSELQSHHDLVCRLLLEKKK